MTTTRRTFAVTVAIVALARLLVFTTYPLNVSGDGFTYFRMLVTGTSNLAHAPGYSFLVGLPLMPIRIALAVLRGPASRLVTPPTDVMRSEPAGGAAPSTEAPAPLTDREARDRLMPIVTSYVSLANHLLDLAAVVVLYLILRAVFSTPMAVVGALVYGLDPWSLQWATVSRPELVQSDVIVFVVGALYWARRAATTRLALGLYAAAGVLFSLAMIVKYNALFLAAIPLAFVLTDPAPWRERVRAGVAFVLAAIVFHWTFVALYHRPSTGTWDFAYARGHNLHVRLLKNPTPLLDADNGPASRALAVLVRVLPPQPPTCCGPSLFSHVDWVPRAERQPWRERWLPVLERRDPAAIDRLWVDVRNKPAGDALAIHYYLGLEPADRLLRDVFFESVRARPLAYLAGSFRFFAEGFVDPQMVLVPVVDETLAPVRSFTLLADPAQRESVGFGFVRFATDEYQSRLLGYKERPALWLPGISLMTEALAWTRSPSLVWWALAALGAVLALMRTPVPVGDAPVAKWGPVVALAGIVIYFACWSLVFHTRNKDIRAVQPFIDVLAALGVAGVVALARRAVSARRPRRERTTL